MLKKICLSKSNQLIFCQESWLTTDQLCYFDIFKSDFYIFGISAMDSTLAQGILRGRTHGGVHIFVRKSLEYSLGQITCITCAERFVIILIGKLLLINVYLPYTRSPDDREILQAILNEIDSFIVDIAYNYVIIAGDYNCDVTQHSATAALINNWMANYNLSLANKLLRIPCTITHTFSSKSHNGHSYIDHFFVSSNPVDLVTYIKDIDASENFSDHSPIVLNLDNRLYDVCEHSKNNSKRLESNKIDHSNNSDKYKSIRLDWENSTKSDYYNLTRDELDGLSKLFLLSDIKTLKAERPDIFTQNGLNDLYRNIVHVLYNSSLKTIKLKNKKSSNKYWWDTNLTLEKKESKEQYNIWSNAGKPKDGPEYIAKCAASKKYRNAIFRKKEQSRNYVGEKLQNKLINTNPKNFWKYWKDCFKKVKATENVKVNELSEDSDIANYLAEEFERTCTPNNVEMHNKFKTKYLSQKQSQTNTVNQPRINVHSVNSAIERIGLNKAAGFDHITIEHIIYAHPSIVIILARLFEIMIFKGMVPDDFGVGVTTPIPKFKGNKNNISADDYRGITICPVISKIFEHSIIDHINQIKTCDRQFGFKKKVGCYNSIHAIRKVIKFFNNRNSTVNVGSIDLRKAFDKTNIYGILCMLQEKKVNCEIINILENWFLKNSTSIKWNNIRSRDIPLLSGVKQGGILSPLLFTIYVDIILEKLEKSGLGCFIGATCCNSYMYADDLMILSVTVTDLQRLFDLCGILSDNLDLPINIAKCHCLRIGPRCHAECKNLTLNGEEIGWVKETKFLGITIKNERQFRCSWDSAKRKFYCNSNVILGRLGTSAPISVLLKLLDSQAIPHLLYGISASALSSKDIKSLSYAYNSMFAKIFHCYDSKVILNCQYFSSSLPFNYLYDYHRYNFFNKLLKADLINLESEVDENDIADYNYLQLKYSLNSVDSKYKVKDNMWNHFHNSFMLNE